MLYIRRSKSKGDRWSSQVAFPGGKKDAEDEDGLYTAKRETWEEIGIDLADKGWLNVGRLGTSARRRRSFGSVSRAALTAFSYFRQTIARSRRRWASGC